MCRSLLHVTVNCVVEASRQAVFGSKQKADCHSRHGPAVGWHSGGLLLKALNGAHLPMALTGVLAPVHAPRSNTSRQDHTKPSVRPSFAKSNPSPPAAPGVESALSDLDNTRLGTVCPSPNRIVPSTAMTVRPGMFPPQHLIVHPICAASWSTDAREDITEKSGSKRSRPILVTLNANLGGRLRNATVRVLRCPGEAPFSKNIPIRSTPTNTGVRRNARPVAVCP